MQAFIYLFWGGEKGRGAVEYTGMKPVHQVPNRIPGLASEFERLWDFEVISFTDKAWIFWDHCNACLLFIISTLL